MGLNVGDSGNHAKDLGLGHGAYDAVMQKIREGGFLMSENILRNGVPYQTEGYVVDLGPNGSLHFGYSVDDPITPQKERYGTKKVQALIKYLKKNGVVLDNAF